MALTNYQRCIDPFGPEYDKLFSNFVCLEQIESWDDFCHWSDDLSGWGFRGQMETSWSLRTSLEYAIRVEYPTGHYHLDRREVGDWLLSSFQKAAILLLPNPPDKYDMASWLSLMQHYGVPTRMLDWTSNAFVALYFALRTQHSEIADPNSFHSVWSVDLCWLNERGGKILGEDKYILDLTNPADKKRELNKLLSRRQTPLVIRVDPMAGNPRIKAQAGFFLWKLVEETPWFDQVLTSMLIHPTIPPVPVIRKAEIPNQLREHFLEKLETLRINENHLFPEEGTIAKKLADLGLRLKSELLERVKVEREKTIVATKHFIETRNI